MIGRASPRRAARRLLVECLLGLGSRRERIAALAAGALDWPHFLRVARRHAIAEGAHLALQRHGATIPEPWRSALREDHELAAARNTVLLSEAARVQRALAEEGIPSVLLKGTALLATVPALMGARHLGDVDLLVPPGELARAVEIVRALGGRSLAPVPVRHDGSSPDPGDPHHAPSLVTPAGATLELHARPGHARATAEWTAVLLARAVTTPWRGATLRVPALDDQLALLCEHALEGHRIEHRLLPRHLGDLAVLSTVGASFPRAGALPGAEGAVRRSRALLEDAATGRPVERRLFLRPLDALRSRLAGRFQSFAVARKRSGTWRVLAPSPAFMAAAYGVSERSPRLPLLYLRRPFDVAWRVLMGR